MSQDLNGTLTAAATLSGNINTENTLTGSFGTSFGSADYNDLTNKPSINSVELTGNKTTSDLGIVIPAKTSDLTNDSGFITGNDLATVATTGNYNDLNHKPNLASVATSGDYNDLTNKPDLAEVATTGSYLSLTNTPSIPAAQVNSDWNAASGVAQILNKPTLATVATSGDYDDLTNKPTIPEAPVNSDWNAASGLAQILNKPNLATVATSGSYNDLTNRPALAAVATSGSYNDLTNRPALATVATTGDYDDLIDKPDLTLLAPKTDLADISITGTTNNTGSTISAGTFFYLNGELVRALTNIANGATLTVNTNYEVITAGGLNTNTFIEPITLSNFNSDLADHSGTQAFLINKKLVLITINVKFNTTTVSWTNICEFNSEEFLDAPFAALSSSSSDSKSTYAQCYYATNKGFLRANGVLSGIIYRGQIIIPIK